MACCNRSSLLLSLSGHEAEAVLHRTSSGQYSPPCIKPPHPPHERIPNLLYIWEYLIFGGGGGVGRVDIRGTGLMSENTCTKNHSHVELEPLKLDDVGLYMDFLGFCRVTRIM